MAETTPSQHTHVRTHTNFTPSSHACGGAFSTTGLTGRSGRESRAGRGLDKQIRAQSLAGFLLAVTAGLLVYALRFSSSRWKPHCLSPLPPRGPGPHPRPALLQLGLGREQPRVWEGWAGRTGGGTWGGRGEGAQDSLRTPPGPPQDRRAAGI